MRVRFAWHKLLDVAPPSEADNALVNCQLCARSPVVRKGLVECSDEIAHGAERVARSSIWLVLGDCEVAVEQLESVASHERGDCRVSSVSSPIHAHGGQLIHTHEEVKADEGK
jgi:hypothetical protein